MNVLAGRCFDKLLEVSGPCIHSVGGFDPDCLRGSIDNPLQAFKMLCLNVETEMSFEAEELALVTGVPADWFEADRLAGDPDDVLRALGVLALVLLSCLRNEAVKYGFGADAAEDPLQAEGALRTVLKPGELVRLSDSH